MSESTESRNLERLILQRVALVKQKSIAEQLDVDASTVHRIITMESGIKINALYDFMELLGLQVVKKGTVMIDSDELKALRYLAGKALREDPE